MRRNFLDISHVLGQSIYVINFVHTLPIPFIKTKIPLSYTLVHTSQSVTVDLLQI
jgi:hypothetical protein